MTKTKIAYDVINHEKEFFKNQWCIRILEGTYANVIYQYDSIKVVEPFPSDDGSELNLEYNTIIIDNPYSSDIIQEKEFADVISEILNEQIIKWVEKTIEINENENRKFDTEEPAA